MAGMTETPKKIDKGAPKWVVTFGDLMSLLLCFFVLLLSFSELDRQKYKQVAGSLAQAFGVQRQTKVLDQPKGIKMIAKDFDQEMIAMRIREEIGRKIQEELEDKLVDVQDQIEVDGSEDEVIIRLMGESTFDSGKAEIRRDLKPLLIEVGNILAQTDGDVVIAGHTDNVPIKRGTYRTNLKLSIARAAEVAEFLLANTNINPKHLSTMGFGEYRPIETNNTSAGRQKNRRVEIIVGNLLKVPDSPPQDF